MATNRELSAKVFVNGLYGKQNLAVITLSLMHYHRPVKDVVRF